MYTSHARNQGWGSGIPLTGNFKNSHSNITENMHLTPYGKHNYPLIGLLPTLEKNSGAAHVSKTFG